MRVKGKEEVERILEQYVPAEGWERERMKEVNDQQGARTGCSFLQSSVKVKPRRMLKLNWQLLSYFILAFS